MLKNTGLKINYLPMRPMNPSVNLAIARDWSVFSKSYDSRWKVEKLFAVKVSPHPRLTAYAVGSNFVFP